MVCTDLVRRSAWRVRPDLRRPASLLTSFADFLYTRLLKTAGESWTGPVKPSFGSSHEPVARIRSFNRLITDTFYPHVVQMSLLFYKRKPHFFGPRPISPRSWRMWRRTPSGSCRQRASLKSPVTCTLQHPAKCPRNPKPCPSPVSSWYAESSLPSSMTSFDPRLLTEERS